MANNFRQSRFRRRDDIAEDVNPSAYIVNLADCMLVLACGFMVAMIAFWNIDISNVEALQKEALEEVDPQEILETIEGGGSYYVEAGKVYQDPNTGQLWMVRLEDGEGSEDSLSSGDNPAPPDTSGGSSGAPSRAEGAD